MRVHAAETTFQSQQAHFHTLQSAIFRQSAIRLFGLLSLILVFVRGVSTVASADDDPKKPAAVRIGKDRDSDADGVLPKSADLELPSAEELLRSKPIDWIVVKTLDVLAVEPVGLRPDTLVKLTSEYDRYLKGRAGMTEGQEKLKDKRQSFLKIQITLADPGPDQDPDYLIDAKMIQKIDYFEDLVLRRANLLIDEGKIPLAYDLLLLVDRRNRENNVRLTEAYETRKRDEAAARTEEERFRFTVPEILPLKVYKTWPRFDETYQRLLFADAEARAARGDLESALRLFENLWDHNSAYPELFEGIGKVVDRLIAGLVEKSDFRQARFFLGRLAARDPQHPIAVQWKTDLMDRTTGLMSEARAASSQGDAPLAAKTIELAARIWPDTPGLKDTHRELIERHQRVRLGVLRLSGEVTKYPFDPPAESDVKGLIDQPLFEPIRVDDRGVRYRSSLLESWEPTDLGRRVQFTLRLKRADWEARPVITSEDILDELAAKMDPTLSSYDERLAGMIERVSVQSPSQFAIHFRKLPLRLEAILQFSVGLDNESQALNPDMPPGALATAGRQRFYEHEFSERQIAYRRVRPQSATIKSRNVDEIVEVRYDSWEHALQGMLRGEITGIPHVHFRDLKALQDDTRFFVTPYAVPMSHFILFNPQSIALRDGQLRRALSLALPREELIKQTILAEINEPYARVASSPFPSTGYAHNRMLAEPTYDPQRAAALAMTAKKKLGGQLPVLRLSCPPDPALRALATTMIEHWRRVGITVKLNDDALDSPDNEWDLIYRTTKIIEPLTELWPMLALRPDAKVESLRPLPERVRRQLLDLERTNDWTSATKLLHRIETELLVEVRYIPLWEVDEFFVTRRHLIGLPARLMHPYHDVERWTLQSWYPQEVPR